MKKLTDKFDDLMINHSVKMVLIIFILLLYVLTAIMVRIDSIGKITKIEQLRKDSRLVNIQNSEDVLGQVTQANQKIQMFKKYNEYLIFDLIIPDSWNQVKIIEIP